jgi:hypothetical protein
VFTTQVRGFLLVATVFRAEGRRKDSVISGVESGHTHKFTGLLTIFKSRIKTLQINAGNQEGRDKRDNRPSLSESELLPAKFLQMQSEIRVLKKFLCQLLHIVTNKCSRFYLSLELNVKKVISIGLLLNRKRALK